MITQRELGSHMELIPTLQAYIWDISTVNRKIYNILNMQFMIKHQKSNKEGS